VGYGKDLQEFLLKHCRVRLILDNQAKRSFASADVNTVIALLSAPDDRREWALDQTARFVMFKAPFEHILSPVIFQEIEEARERYTTPEYRVFPLSQEALLEDGSELAGGVKGGGVSGQKKGRRTTSGPLIKVARYIGNKWGGKYLRAPEIYWTYWKKGNICACLNSTLVWLFIEILGRRVVGGFVRMLVNDLKWAPLVVNPELLTKKERYEIVQAFISLSKRPVYPIRQEIQSDGTGGIHIQSDRLSLDKIIFDVLELSQTEREIVYKSVLHFVEDRFEKESSLSPKERRKRLAAAEKTGGIWAGLPEEEDNGE
jgi:hypothetical protein